LTSPQFFQELREELSQGDIIANVPHGFVDDLGVCRVEGADQYGPALYMPAEHHKNPAAFQRKTGRDALHLHVKVGLAMVLWPDCKLDGFSNKARPGKNNVKSDKIFAGVAPLVDLNAYKPEEHTKIKNGQRPTLFYVPALGSASIPESVVDLRRIFPIKQSLLVDGRVASVSDGVRDALVPHLSWFFTEHRIGERVACPSCNTTIELNELVRLPPEEDPPAE
jgi:hypothetical protein